MTAVPGTGRRKCAEQLTFSIVHHGHPPPCMHRPGTTIPATAPAMRLIYSCPE